MWRLGPVVLVLAVALSPLTAGPGEVLSHVKVSGTQGGLLGALAPFDFFGTSVAALGDLDGDGVVDLAVGAIGDDDGGSAPGAVWVMFMNETGTVQLVQKISDTQGGFTGELDTVDRFGWSVAPLGDLDRDGAVDLVVGAPLDDDGGLNNGAVWLLFLNEDGTVKRHSKISATGGGATLASVRFGSSVALLNDLDGDDVDDIAVGAVFDNDGGPARGALWIINLNPDGSPQGHQKISDTQGGFTGELEDGDRFGWSAASLGDLDGDGVDDLATGAIFDNDGGFRRGAVWVLFLNPDGTVKSHQKISAEEGGFTGNLDDQDFFGASVSALGDVNGDGVVDLAVGAYGDDDAGLDRGAVWVLFLNPDGTVNGDQKISGTEGGFEGFLDDEDEFGRAVAGLGDLNGDGLNDLAVGVHLDDDVPFNSGAVFMLFLDEGSLPVPATSRRGLAAMMVLLLAASTALLFLRRRARS